MSKPALNLVFTGPAHSVKVYAEGKMVVHTSNHTDEESTIVISLRGGTHRLRTLATLAVSAPLGPCTIAVKHGPTKTLKTGGRMTIETGSTFTVSGEAAILQIVADQGPGYGGPFGDPDLP